MDEPRTVLVNKTYLFKKYLSVIETNAYLKRTRYKKRRRYKNVCVKKKGMRY